MTLQLGLANNLLTNTSSNNNSRSLRGVTISSIVLKLGMFAHSATSLSQFLISSRAFCYILTKFQNYNLCESLIKSFEAPKSEKTTTTK